MDVLRDIDEPEPDEPVWRYMDLSKLISIIETSALYFNWVDKYEDPLEGWLPAGKFEEQQYDLYKDLSDVPSPIQETLWKFRKLVYTSCWTIDKGQSDAMWSSYLSSDKGVAIQTTVGQLKSQLPSDQGIKIGKVNYVDWDEKEISVEDYDPLVPAFYKRKAFEHEKELRLAFRLTLEHDQVYSSDAYKLNSPPGRKIQVDTEALIDTIYTSPRAPGWFVQTVEDMVDSYGLDVDVEHSALLETPFDTVSEEF